jgi:hypothetical protein
MTMRRLLSTVNISYGQVSQLIQDLEILSSTRTIVMSISQSSSVNERMMYPLTTTRIEKAIQAMPRNAAEIPIMALALSSRPMMLCVRWWCPDECQLLEASD